MPGPGDMERGVWSSSLQLAPPSLLPCPLQGPSAWPEVAARKLLPFFPSRALSFPLRRDQPANPSHRLTALSLSLSLRHDAAWIPNPKQRQSIQNTMVDVFKVGPATTYLLAHVATNAQRTKSFPCTVVGSIKSCRLDPQMSPDAM